MSSPIPACDYNCFYATTTTLHTFATRHTLVELAQCITANISAPSRSLGSLRHDSRKVRPHAHREHGASPNSVRIRSRVIITRAHGSRCELTRLGPCMQPELPPLGLGPAHGRQGGPARAALQPPLWSPGERRSRVETSDLSLQCRATTSPENVRAVLSGGGADGG